MSGIGIRYPESAITDTKHQACATNLIIGERILPQILICVADARPYQLQDLLPADARFKVLIFTGDITDGGQRTRLQKLADDMEKPEDIFEEGSPQGTENNEVFDMFAICSGKKWKLWTLHNCHNCSGITGPSTSAFFFPESEVTDYSCRFFVDDVDTTGDTRGERHTQHLVLNPLGL